MELTNRLPDGGRFVALDALRGIAALAIAAYHLHATGPLLGSAIVRNGWIAVDFFFVLSGFVIAASYGARLAEGFPIGRFMTLRLGRVYPLHIVILIAFVAVEVMQWLLRVPGLTLREPLTGGHSPGELIMTVFLVQGFEQPLTSDWNGPSWSISVELWLYLMIALVWRAVGTRGWIVAALGACIAGYLLSFRYPDLAAPFSSMFLRGVLGFGTGVCAWRLWSGGGWPRLQGTAATISEGMVLLVAGAVVLGRDSIPAASVVSVILFASVVLTFAGEGGSLSRLLRMRPFVWLGILSYSIYMVHGMVIGRGVDLLRLAGLGSPTAGGLNSDLIGFSLITASVALSWFTWRWIEEPARSWSRRRAARMGAAREEAATPAF